MAQQAPAKGEMTIRELAERSGMTVRNIRAHQARGLLPPPVVRGRTGFYNDDHVARIELTREMQADGLNLEAIRRVLESSDGAAGEIFDFTRAIRVPFEDETPEIYDADELATTWGADALNPKLVAHGEKLGILRMLSDGRVEVISPRMQEAAVELAKLGIGAEAAMGVADELRRHAEGVGPRLRRSLRQGGLGAVRRSGASRGGLAADPRDARADAPARLDHGARGLPDRDGRGDGEGERADPAPGGGEDPQKAETVSAVASAAEQPAP